MRATMSTKTICTAKRSDEVGVRSNLDSELVVNILNELSLFLATDSNASLLQPLFQHGHGQLVHLERIAYDKASRRASYRIEPIQAKESTVRIQSRVPFHRSLTLLRRLTRVPLLIRLKEARRFQSAFLIWFGRPLRHQFQEWYTYFLGAKYRHIIFCNSLNQYLHLIYSREFLDRAFSNKMPCQGACYHNR